MVKINSDNQSVTKDMFLIDVITKYPEVAPLLTTYGLHCLGCYFSETDTIETGAKMHGMDEEIIDMMIKDVNIFIEKLKRAEIRN
jgi:hybrid cluster-associated redox disulfide protein